MLYSRIIQSYLEFCANIEEQPWTHRIAKFLFSLCQGSLGGSESACPYKSSLAEIAKNKLAKIIGLREKLFITTVKLHIASGFGKEVPKS